MRKGTNLGTRRAWKYGLIAGAALILGWIFPPAGGLVGADLYTSSLERQEEHCREYLEYWDAKNPNPGHAFQPTEEELEKHEYCRNLVYGRHIRIYR